MPSKQQESEAVVLLGILNSMANKHKQLTFLEGYLEQRDFVTRQAYKRTLVTAVMGACDSVMVNIEITKAPAPEGAETPSDKKHDLSPSEGN